MQKIIQRARAKTPPFFTRLRNIGLTVSALSTALLTAPVSLPATVTSLAGYLLTAGTITSAISQLTVKEAKETQASKSPKKGGKHDGDTPA